MQDAINFLYEYQESGAGNFNAWVNQIDIFGDQKSPSQKYSAATLALAKQMNDAKSQKAISTNIIELAQKMNGKEGDLFFPAVEGVSFEEAIGVKDNKLPEIQISEKSVQLVKDIKAALSLQGNNNKKLAIEKLYADKNSKYTENEVKAALEVNKDFEKLVQDMQDDNLLNKICKT